MDRRLEWIARNGAFAVALYAAVVTGAAWLRYAVAAFVWYTLGSTLWRRSARVRPEPALETAEFVFDALVLTALFLGRSYWTAFAYAAACGLRALLRLVAVRRS